MRIRTELRTDSIFIDNPQIFFKLLIVYLVQQNKVIQEFVVKDENHPQLTDLKLSKGFLMEAFLDNFTTFIKAHPASRRELRNGDKLGIIMFRAYTLCMRCYQRNPDITQVKISGFVLNI